ncbi:Uncharacterised protein [Fusobacterium necrophorum subsp. necrophorum]|nr:Uncharacterised protein [Fusobacterium necrophorum subsp. necrophorum]
MYIFSFIPYVVVVALLLVFISKGIKIVPESNVYIVEKLGKYHQSLSSGLNLSILFSIEFPESYL